MLLAHSVSVFRGERLVLDRVSFAVPQGGALLLTGPNGAGKSTLLRVLAGLKRPDAGIVTWGGSSEYASRLAYLGHQDAMKPGLSAAENLRFAASRWGRKPTEALEHVRTRWDHPSDKHARQNNDLEHDRHILAGSVRTDHALEALGLAQLAGVPARMLSAGQKRRLALARLVLQSAPLWLLDEPTLGMDAASVAAFGQLMAAHRAGGGIIVAATHLPLPLEHAAALPLGGPAGP